MTTTAQVTAIPPQTIESARKAFHDLSIECADVDSKLIDVNARRAVLLARQEELERRRVAARDHLVKLHADEQPAAAAPAAVTDLLNAPKMAPLVPA